MAKNLAVCVVGDFPYLYRYFSGFKNMLQEKGGFFGDIVIITSIFTPTFLIRSTYGKNVSILRFKKIKFPKKITETLNSNNTNGQPNRNINKYYQWHKLHIFDKKIKKWNYIFYLDINMSIHGDLSELFKEAPLNKLLARADSYPQYDRTLSSQFDENSETFKRLCEKYDLDITNYFQTGLLFFDTSIIDKNTKKELVELAIKYPCTITNEQAIFNLYFIFEKKLYQELPVEIGKTISYFYWKLEGREVLITKQNRIQYK